MFLSLKLENKIKKEIVEGYSKGDTISRVKKEFGIRGIELFYDCCYATVCREMGINRKKGKELKATKIKLKPKE